ncbi:hypothetical protein ACFLV2_01595 [Chloroflexota bacterium]
MDPKYSVGQKVKIRPNEVQQVSPRDCDLDKLAGQTGEIVDYFCLSPRTGENFVIYTVRTKTNRDGIALHEDEIEAQFG